VNDVTTLERIREALLVEAFEGVERTADVYAFGAFQLLGALLDTASCLASRRGSRADRFVRFVRTYLPEGYHHGGLPKRLYDDLRCGPLHNYSTIGLLLMDRQDETLHLTQQRGRTIIHLQTLLADVKCALADWWRDVETSPEKRTAVLADQQAHPIVWVETIEVGLPLPTELSETSRFPPGASAYGGVMTASGNVRPERRQT
jgi:hypothetical protein